MKPWSLVYPLSPALSSVSSQVSQVRHGVGPPEQLMAVPPRLTYSLVELPCRSTTSVLVPPAAAGSYVRSAGATTLIVAVGLHSWFRTSRDPPCRSAKAPIPSNRLGTCRPSGRTVPSRDRIW
jgi:hypothetical protein